MNRKTLGVLAVLCASLMWALEPVFAKLAYLNSDFLQTQLVRVGVIALIALGYALFTNKASLKVSRSQFSKIAYIAIAGTLFADLVYFYALATVPALNAVLLGHLQPVFIILLGFFVLKEDKLTKFDYIGILLMIIAGLFVTSKSPENLFALKIGTFGDLLVLCATAVWATTAIVMRKYLREMNAGAVTFYRFFIAFAAFSIYLISISPKFIFNAFQFLLGVVGGVGTILYYESLKRIKAAQVSALELAAPFFAAVLGFLILVELVTLLQVFGILLLFGGVYFLSKKEEI